MAQTTYDRALERIGATENNLVGQIGYGKDIVARDYQNLILDTFYVLDSEIEDDIIAKYVFQNGSFLSENLDELSEEGRLFEMGIKESPHMKDNVDLLKLIKMAWVDRESEEEYFNGRFNRSTLKGYKGTNGGLLLASGANKVIEDFRESGFPSIGSGNEVEFISGDEIVFYRVFQ